MGTQSTWETRIRDNLALSSKKELLPMIWKVCTPKLMLLFEKTPLEPSNKQRRLPRRDGRLRDLLMPKEKQRLQRTKKSSSHRLRHKKNNCLVCNVLLYL